jgi:hypothetical protein
MGKKSPFNKQKEASAPFLKSGGSSSIGSVDDAPPAFSFEKMQDQSGNSFNCCEDEDRLYLIKRIFMLSRMPWKEIRQAGSQGLGAESIQRFRIKRPIPSSVTEDVESFYSLHYVGKKRFLGYRVGQVFHILWVDHNYEVYNHGS